MLYKALVVIGISTIVAACASTPESVRPGSGTGPSPSPKAIVAGPTHQEPKHESKLEVREPVLVTVTAPAIEGTSNVEVLRDTSDALRTKLAEVEAALSQAEMRELQTKREAELDKINSVLFWVKLVFALIGFVALVGVFATLFWSIPLGRKTLAGIGLSSGAGIVAAQVYGALFLNVALVMYIVLGLGAVIGVLYLVYHVRKALHHATAYGNSLQDHVEPGPLSIIGNEARFQQMKDGVHGLLNHIRKGEPKT